MNKLQGKRAVVTGGASGIGFAIARAFASAGAHVSLLDLQLDRVASAAASMGNSFDRAVDPYACDVSDVASVASCISEIYSRTSGIDVLVNCAGIAHVGSLATTEHDDFDRLFAVNVRGTYLVMRATLPAMVEARRGVILNLASIAATAGISDRFAYSMTKGAVRAMTMSVAKDFVSFGIRCNCISPARIHTPFVDGFLSRNYPGREVEKAKELSAAQPIGRMGTPEEVAGLASFLCSDESSFVTGADYAIDGGYLNIR